MNARLKVLSGSAAGKELKLKEGQFLIGRSDSCHLRPRSDAISRKHCVLFIDDKHVRVRDLKSRNGTLVNGEKIEQDVTLKSGDKISVGPLSFEILFAPADAPQQAAPQPSASKPAAPKRAPQAAPQAQEKATAQQGKAKAKSGANQGRLEDEDIFSWLEEADEVDREFRRADPTTRQYKVEAGEEPGESDTVDISKADAQGSDTSVGKKVKKEKKEPGKLPTVPKDQSQNSQEAAADALKQFFKRS